MEHAYGLYTHIQSNKRRSIALLIGLFFLVYVMVYAGALIAEVTRYNAPLDWFLKKAWQDTLMAAPFATIGTLIWMFIAYKFNQSIVELQRVDGTILTVNDVNLQTLGSKTLVR